MTIIQFFKSEFDCYFFQHFYLLLLGYGTEEDKALQNNFDGKQKKWKWNHSQEKKDLEAHNQ